MPHTVTWIDRLRIERIVWMLDQRLYDLPRKSRIANRREVRENMLTAAHDIGTTDALKHLGNSRELAAAYLSAEFGEGLRVYWVAATTFAVTAVFLSTWILSEAASAFGSGIAAANPHATGTFSGSGIRYFQDAVTFTFVHGKGSYVGGALSPVSWAIWFIAIVLIGRLWRFGSTWRRRRVTTTGTV
jgi:hypothetical protein